MINEGQIPINIMKNSLFKQIVGALFLLTVTLILTACGGSDTGDDNQGGEPPFAIAKVLGSTEKTRELVEVRSGSLVLLSGADSDNRTPGVPILNFNWEQTDQSGYEVVLYERNRTTSVFIAPEIPVSESQGVELTFELVVTDARGVTAKDIVRVLVKPVLDENHFLISPNDNEEFLLVVAAVDEDVGEQIDSDGIYFDVIMTKTAHWHDRAGNAHSLTLDEITFNGVVPSGLAPGPESADNPLYQVVVPMFNVDEINAHFQGRNRSQRLELENVAGKPATATTPVIPPAYVELSFQLTQQSSGVDLGLYLAETDIVGTELSLLADFPGQGGQVLTTDDESLRIALGVESRRSANNYYDCIDPQGNATTLRDWLEQAGFVDSNGEHINTESVAHAAYLNNYDLNFGRDMFVRQDENSNVYSFVTNYPTLENIASGRNEFAVVAMEFSPAPTGNCGDDIPPDDTKKIVKFYAFVPDTTTGEYVRMPTMNFDGRGERSLPGVCVSCHYGSTNTETNPNSTANANGFNTEILGAIDASAANLDSSFMPWDLDSLLYTHSEDPRLIDPAYASSGGFGEVTGFTAAFSREALESEFRRMNQMVLDTFTYDTDNLLRFETPIKMLHGWYGNGDTVEDLVFSDINDTGLLLLLIDTLPDNPFDGSYVQKGWRDDFEGQGREELYHQVFARNCRLCHIQIASTSDPDPVNNFDTYEEFIENGSLVNYVFERGIMPLSRLTYDRFWVDYYGEPSAAERLRDHLNNDTNPDNDVADDARPGLPLASIVPATNPRSEADILIDFDGYQLFDGSGSLFADRYDWKLDGSSIINTDGNLVNTPTLTFPLQEMSLQPGDTYEISLTVSDQSSMSSTEETRSLLVNNNSPISEGQITVSVSEGLSVLIDIFEQLCPGHSEDSENCRPFFGDINAGDKPSIFLSSLPDNGTLDVSNLENGMVTFTSTQTALSGDGSFQFIFIDSFDESSSLPSNVTIVVNPIGAPTVGNDSCTIDALSSNQLCPDDPLANDFAGDSQLTLRIVSVSNTGGVANSSDSGGTVTLDQGSIRYTPPRFLTGVAADSFEYTVEDDNPVDPKSNTGTVRVTITPTVTHTLLMAVEDADGEPPTVQSSCRLSGCHDGSSTTAPDYGEYANLRRVAVSTTGSQYGPPHNAFSDDIALAEPTTDAQLLNSILFKNGCDSIEGEFHSGGNVLCSTSVADGATITENDLNALGQRLLEWVRQAAPE